MSIAVRSPLNPLRDVWWWCFSTSDHGRPRLGPAQTSTRTDAEGLAFKSEDEVFSYPVGRRKKPRRASSDSRAGSAAEAFVEVGGAERVER